MVTNQAGSQDSIRYHIQRACNLHAIQVLRGLVMLVWRKHNLCPKHTARGASLLDNSILIGLLSLVIVGVLGDTGNQTKNIFETTGAHIRETHTSDEFAEYQGEASSGRPSMGTGEGPTEANSFLGGEEQSGYFSIGFPGNDGGPIAGGGTTSGVPGGYPRNYGLGNSEDSTQQESSGEGPGEISAGNEGISGSFTQGTNSSGSIDDAGSIIFSPYNP